MFKNCRKEDLPDRSSCRLGETVAEKITREQIEGCNTLDALVKSVRDPNGEGALIDLKFGRSLFASLEEHLYPKNVPEEIQVEDFC
ncbi:hypothetical protein TNCV_3292311 [Trichonephila clavipes]|nr:hypothetical protein TNCV_3292311 [Trichonephila clavipes]